MPIQGKKNQYRGVNAHANGWLQNAHKWRSFHSDHITDLARALNARLPPGYIALSEQSLQVDVVDPNTRRFFPRPDVSIFDQRRDRPNSLGSLPDPVGIVTPTLDTIFLQDTELSAVVVYETSEDADLGRPVTRFELLSPSNKLPNSSVQDYENNRNAALLSGVALVEIDYLHHQPPVNRVLPVYPDETGSQPYSITVHDPRPSIYQGQSYTFPFGVDQPIPSFDVPLAPGDKLPKFDLGAVYSLTFENSRLLWEKADYAQLPVDWETYNEVDQGRIQERMVLIHTMQTAGHDLDKEGPFVTDSLTEPGQVKAEDRGNDLSPSNEINL